MYDVIGTYEVAKFHTSDVDVKSQFSRRESSSRTSSSNLNSELRMRNFKFRTLGLGGATDWRSLRNH